MTVASPPSKPSRPSRAFPRFRLLFAAGLLAALPHLSAAAADPCLPAKPGRCKTLPAPAPAEPTTAARNAQVLQELPFADQQDFEDARRGFVGTLPDVTMKDESGNVVFTLRGFEFLQQGEAPPSVNPSLWRLAQLNLNHGLFKVVDRVYQIRGFDLANMTIIEGDTGLIIIDPLEAVETSKAGLDLYYRLTGSSPLARPVKAVLYTHSHHDHYAGVRGVLGEADLSQVQVLAPSGFLEAVVSENVYAGFAMSRRAEYMYGVHLPKSERGMVDAGLGKGKSNGTTSLVAPTDSIGARADDPLTRRIDGVDLEFFLAPETEAPAEMTVYLPQFKVLDAAELACPLLHNILTLRGAQARDARKWSADLDRLIVRYGASMEVLIAQHHWPRWGQDRVLRLLADQRDLYKFLHDQTLHLMNKGLTPIEIAARIQLPDGLARLWSVRGYYGTVSHDVKAIYQRYLGWFDGNPANLDPLPPVEAARKFVEYMGGPQAVLAHARQDFKRGEYRWVAQVMNQVVFAYPDFAEARHLQAAALEQLGYQAESAPWRNFYLTGAKELREGIATPPGPPNSGADTLRAMPTPLVFDYWGVLLNAERANGKRLVLNWTFTDDPVGDYALTLSNSALTHRAGWHDPSAVAGFTLSRVTLDRIILGATDLRTEVLAGRVLITGNGGALAELLAMFDRFEPGFPIVTP